MVFGPSCVECYVKHGRRTHASSKESNLSTSKQNKVLKASSQLRDEAMTAGGADVIVPNAEDAQLRGQASQFAGECLCYASETEALWGRL